VSLLKEVFGRSPFSALVEHARKVHECVELICPLMQAVIDEDYEEVHHLQDKVSQLEYEADQIKHAVREHLPRRYFMPVEREDLDHFLHHIDSVADGVEDFAVVLFIRNTKIHPELSEEFKRFAESVLKLSGMMIEAAEGLEELAETSFGGAEAKDVLNKIGSIGEEEWQCDRLQRQVSINIYKLEKELDPITISFYEKMLRTLSEVANAAENTAEFLRTMIVK